MRLWILSLVLVAVLGCAKNQPTHEAAVATQQKAISEGGVKDADLAKYKKEYELSKALYVKEPDNKIAKETYTFATVRYATSTMYSDSLDFKVKYREALKLFREALKVDPKNEDALKSKNMIEDIYTKMGRPIPQS
ncbi:MAG: hypothetical protein QOJ65_1190 [Fimbriimonadaceae bacterium]|jgi:tetratricopeptide (TPR) repeat protein|nr:hypothetical protein [Fimbriimonadaceae bacterium]